MSQDDFFSKFFGPNHPFFGGSAAGSRRPDSGNNRNDEFFDNDFHRMFNEMEDMMKRFHHGHFNMIEDDLLKDPFRNRSIEEEPPSSSNETSKDLRDKFLKPKGSDEEKKQKEKSSQITPYNKPPFFGFFDPFHKENKFYEEPETKFEEDLDAKIAREGLDKVLREDLFKKNKQEYQFPQFQSFGQSVSVKRVQRPDGSIEEVKTIRSSDGKEEKTVTRIIGDKVHSVIEKKNQTGIEETEEIFQNFDEKEIDEFNKKWNNKSLLGRSDGETNEQPSLFNPFKSVATVPPAIEESKSKIGDTQHKENKSLVSKIFSWFKKDS